MMLIILQGTDVYIPVKSTTATFIAYNGLDKIIGKNVVETSTGLSIFLNADDTKNYAPGKYSYQIIAGNALEEEGTLKVKANLIYSTDIDSYWRKVLKAIDDRLAGRATDATKEVTVGDKKLEYLSISQLLQLREFVEQKIAEEDAEEGDESATSKNDQKKIIYAWRGF